ncbi:Uncharacterised protein [Vibrio cholerae]|nr:Uncharacterised protein [Vibrio cholerae]
MLDKHSPTSMINSSSVRLGLSSRADSKSSTRSIITPP